MDRTKAAWRFTRAARSSSEPVSTYCVSNWLSSISAIYRCTRRRKPKRRHLFLTNQRNLYISRPRRKPPSASCDLVRQALLGFGPAPAALHAYHHPPNLVDLRHLHMYWPPKAKRETFIFDKPKKSLHKPPARGTLKYDKLQIARGHQTEIPLGLSHARGPAALRRSGDYQQR
jgi:hypothetical protein